jgi:hypothetical protein
MAQLQIRVYDTTLNLTGIIEDYESANFTRSFFEAGSWSITINKNIPNATLLIKNNIVQFGTDTRDTGKITSVESRIDENGKGSQKLIVSGYDLRYMFTQRIIKAFNDVDAFYLSAPGETIIKTLISLQCGATCLDANRIFPLLTIATDQARGGTYTLSSKYTQVYEECAKVATQSLLGWYIYIDHTTKTYVLDCEIGIDRSTSQTVNPYCLFSPDMDSLKSAQFIDDTTTYKNLVYVGGDGQGSARIIHTGYDTTEPTGDARFELFSDASSVSTTASLTAKAQAVLKQYNQTYELTGDVLVMSPYIYKEEYNVGDICTVKFNDVELDVRILEINESWQWGEYSISSVWGKPLSLLSGQVSSLSTSATSSRSTSEAGTNVSGMKSGVVVYNLTSADHVMDGSECLYNLIELSGTLTANRVFTFYLDTTRLYGRKAYKVLISAIADTGIRTITFTGGTAVNVVIDINTAHDLEMHDIYVDALGNVYAGVYETFDHKFVQLNGVSGGQTIIGGTGTTDSLTYRTTSGVGATGANHIFQVGNNGATEAMRILNTGFIGIGLAAPLSKLHFSGGLFNIDNYSASNYINFRRADGTQASPIESAAGALLGGFLASGYHTDDTPAFGLGNGLVAISSTEIHTSTAQGTKVRLESTPNGSTIRSNVLIFDQSGYLGINTTIPPAMLSLTNTLSGAHTPCLSLSNMGVADNSGTAIYMGYNPIGSFFGIRLLQTGNPSLSRTADFSIQVHNTTASNDDTAWDTAFKVTRTKDIGIGCTVPISLTEIQGGLTTVGSVLTLGTKEPSVVANDILGRVNFYAPLDTAGTDANALAASIVAISEATFSATVNATSLQFRTGASEIATTKMTISSVGLVTVENDLSVKGATTLGDASTDLITHTGRAIFRTVASDPQHATPASRPAGSVGELVYYAAKMYFCVNSATPTWEKITSA